MFIQKLKLAAISLAAVGGITAGALAAIGLPAPAKPAADTAKLTPLHQLLPREFAERQAAIAQRKQFAMGDVGAPDPDTAEIQALMRSAKGDLNWDQAKHEINEKHANIARAQAHDADPAYNAEIQALVNEAKGKLTFAQAKHEIDEKYLNIERAAQAGNAGLSPQEIEQHVAADRAKSAAEKGN